MTAYYNEIDPFAAQWLRNLIKNNLIAPGDVDERSIEDICPNELDGYTQCHFFAGIGVWSYALRQSGWPDDREVWTGSCPCQPFSTAGKGAGFADERHLWPSWHYLIGQRKPDVVFGEQVSSKDGLAWLDLVQADMEGAGYAGGAVDLCAAGVGAPHIRQRQWLVFERMVNAAKLSQRPHYGRPEAVNEFPGQTGGRGLSGWLANTDLSDAERQQSLSVPVEPEQKAIRSADINYWAGVELIECADGKARPVEPSVQPLAYGTPNRLGRLRGYGNCIVAQAAQAVIESFMEIRP